MCGETIDGCFLSLCRRVASSGEVVNYVLVAWAVKSIGQLSRFRTHDINLRKSGAHCRIYLKSTIYVCKYIPEGTEESHPVVTVK